MKERIQKLLAAAGVASRRAVEQMVQQGRIAVNGRIVTDLPVLIDPQTDRVTVDGENVPLRGKQGGRRIYILMNKPKGVYTTNVSQGEQKRAVDLLPPGFGLRVYPVGQMDADSTGLLLLTNDGELTNHLTHPRYGVPRVYRVIVDGLVSDATAAALQAGVWLADTRTGQGFKASVSHIRIARRVRDRSVLEMTVRESRNRQIARMLAKFGHKVRELTRVRIGPLTLEGLKPGESRELSPREVRQLLEYAEKRPVRRRGAAPHDDIPDADA
jgi:pseudouridine synthase